MSNPQLFFPSPLDQQVKMFVNLTSSSLNMRIPPTVPLSDAFLQLFFQPRLAPARRLSAASLIAQMVYMAADKNIPIVVGLNGGQLMQAVIDAVNDPLTTTELQALSATAIGIIAEKAPNVVCAVPNCIKIYVDLLASEDKGTSNIGGGLYNAQIEAAVLLSRICSYGNGIGAKEIVKNDGTKVICKRAVDWKFAPSTTNLFRGLRACVSSLVSLAKFGELPAVIKNGGLDTMSNIISSHGPAAGDALSFVLSLTAAQPQREVLMKSGVCDVLIKSLPLYQDVNVQRRIVQIIGNLATDQESMDIIAKTDITSQINDIMSSAEVDSPLWLQCIKCLLNLLVKEKTIKEFCDNDGIVTIIEGLKNTNDLQAKQFLIYLIANILTIDDFVPTFIEEDGVNLVYPYIQDPSREVAVNAARAVSNLCTTLDEPRVAILENDGVKTLSKALSRPELFTYALEISKSLALCTKKVDCFKDEEFMKEVSKFLHAPDTKLRGESVKVFMNLARTTEMRRFIFQKKVLEPILALALKDPEKDIRYNSLRTFVSMSSEGRVRKWANENGVVRTVQKMTESGTLAPEIMNQSQILLKNLNIAYESNYSDSDYKELDITAKYRSAPTTTTTATAAGKASPQRPLKKQQAVTGKVQLAKKQQVPAVQKRVPSSSASPTIVHKTTPSPPPGSVPTVQKKVATPGHKVTTTPSPPPTSTSTSTQQKYPMAKTTTTTPTYKSTAIVSKPSPSAPAVQKKAVTSVSPSPTPSERDSFSESSSASGTERDVDVGSISDSMSFISDDEADSIPILSATMQAELLEKQRAAVMQARIEEDLARERAEKEERKREEERKRKAEEEAKERAAEEARVREAEKRRKEEAERLNRATEAEKKRIDEEFKRKIDLIMSDPKSAREEEIRREHEENEARKKEIEERKRLEEARRAEEEAARRAEAEAAARKKRKEEERAARHERRRLEKERRAKEEAAAKRAEEEAKLKALEEQQRKARERDAKEKEDARKRHIRRTYIVQEIFDTEKNYVEGLTHMVNAYMQPLIEKAQSRRDMIITPQQIKLIFSSVEIILNFASTLLGKLQDRMELWNETTCIGDIFLEVMPFFVSYVDYVNNYPTALETLNGLHSNERFQAFLDRVEKERPDLYLPSVIVSPVQRIPRYILLLSDLLKHTDPEHPDYAHLEKAAEKILEIGNHINEAKRVNENSAKMSFIQLSIKRNAVQVFVPGRSYVSEMSIGIVKKMGMVPRIGITYLFSDSVLVGRSLPKNKLLFKCLVPYSALKTEVLEDSKNLTNGLKIINKSPNHKDKHSEWVITFNSPSERKTWLDSVAENSREFEKRKSVIITRH